VLRTETSLEKNSVALSCRQPTDMMKYPLTKFHIAHLFTSTKEIKNLQKKSGLMFVCVSAACYTIYLLARCASWQSVVTII